eukprot:scaffold110617_cov45-Phaeocystis_antarctica.AAC.1
MSPGYQGSRGSSSRGEVRPRDQQRRYGAHPSAREAGTSPRGTPRVVPPAVPLCAWRVDVSL